MYNTSYSVLGVLISRVAGVSLGEFFRSRIFVPLGMKDTAFAVTPEKIGRLTTCYHTNAFNGQAEVFDGMQASGWATPPTFPSGSGGLVSTIDDYLLFASMMHNYGISASARILERRTVELMTSDHLTVAQKGHAPFVPDFWDQYGWGFGMSVVARCNNIGPSVGSFGWDGAFGTFWCSDPKEDMISILMMQRAMTPFLSQIESDFYSLAYQTIGD